MEMLMEERPVLCVLRNANQIAPAASAISRLTELDSPTVEFLLGGLLREVCVRADKSRELRVIGLYLCLKLRS
jgi:hypothetical protein